MSEKWVNAVIEVTVPMDVPVDASAQEKIDAAVKVWDQMTEEGIQSILDSSSVVVRHETVEDGEPL